MRLVLHIGSEKTGTTAFQAWAQENREVLAQEGVWYARTLDPPNHRPLSIMGRAGDEVEDGFHTFGINSPEAHAVFVARHAAALAGDVAAARAAGARVYLISSEHCQSRLNTQAQVARLADYLRPLFEEIEVVCFLRPQVDLAQSLASTLSRAGVHVSRRILGSVGPGNSYYNYGALLARWAAVFGREAVTVVPFKRAPSPVEWFRKHLWIDADTLTPERRVNAALDYRCVALMNHLVGPDGRGRDGRLTPIMRRLRPETLPCEIKLSFSRADAEVLQARFAAENAALVAAWPELSPRDLEVELGRYPELGTLDQLDAADFGPILGEVIGRLHAELALARARIAGMEAQTALQDGRVEEAATLLATAQQRLRHGEGYAPFAKQVSGMQAELARQLVQLEVAGGEAVEKKAM